eukprot:jgi/Mesvir1/15897/Mv02800-RA.1
MDRDMARLIQGLEEVEKVGDDILALKAKSVLCDATRNGNREALRWLRSFTPTATPGAVSPGDQPKKDAKVWVMRPGGVLLRMPTSKALAMVTRDQEGVELENTLIASKLKEKTLELANKGGAPETVGPGLLQAMATLKG